MATVAIENQKFHFVPVELPVTENVSLPAVLNLITKINPQSVLTNSSGKSSKLTAAGKNIIQQLIKLSKEKAPAM